ncbi:MAG: glycosyltransferase [Cytophagaceae bacterium]|nr:MAG: glycosyltransferase [Cytophagaceae bacterium]
MPLNIFCASQNYRSHAKAAQAYIDIFESLSSSFLSIVDDPDDADISYLHLEPDRIRDLLEEVPSLRRTYRIGYCVWEADRLPDSHIEALSMLDEVWTASWYNWACFSRVHPRVRWIPHVIHGVAQTTPEDLIYLRDALRLDLNTFCYLYIGANLPRKNIKGLVQAFQYVNAREPKTRLIIKTGSQDKTCEFRHEGAISYCTNYLTESQIAGLYTLSGAYVSPHFAEGWGLTITDAMQHQKLCVATAYSGNMTFMTPANSLLVSYDVSPIAETDQYHIFTGKMAWAQPHQESLEHNMLAALAQVQSGEATARIAQATQDLRRFDHKHVRCLVRHRLERIVKRLTR